MTKLFLITMLIVLLATPWIWNIVKFSNCDFESNYKCEVVHVLGIVVPPAAFITVWFDSDSK